MGYLARQVSGCRDQLKVIPKVRKYDEALSSLLFFALFCFGIKRDMNIKYVRNKTKIIKIE